MALSFTCWKRLSFRYACVVGKGRLEGASTQASRLGWELACIPHSQRISHLACAGGQRKRSNWVMRSEKREGDFVTRLTVIVSSGQFCYFLGYESCPDDTGAKPCDRGMNEFNSSFWLFVDFGSCFLWYYIFKNFSLLSFSLFL